MEEPILFKSVFSEVFFAFIWFIIFSGKPDVVCSLSVSEKPDGVL
jgi:hypothetical protein